MKRLLLSLFSAAALLFAGAGPMLAPLPAQAQVSVDAGRTGVLRGMHLLCSSAVAATHTGNTTKTTLATCTVPAGAMGSNGGLLIYSTWSMTNNANAKTARIELGATAFKAVSYSSIATSHDIRRIRNRNSASSQVGSTAAASSGSVSQTTAAVVTGTENTANTLDLVFSIQLGVGTDSATLESYEVWQLP